MNLEQELIRIMKTNENLMRDLEWVRQLELPQGCIAAGYVRNYVWDYLHGYPNRNPMNDVDILYFDPSDFQEETEKHYDAQLKQLYDPYDWSVKNQARMHIRNEDHPYVSVAEAMKRWPETATAVGVRLDDDMNIEVIAPFGLDDLFQMVIRKSPYFKDEAYFKSRVRGKKWLDIWPQLKMM
ncbi:nucleotidyltransferase family protein [Paenibacillus faecalis]|uniref:nucleotidyltransferase family protein n=1 Tax=Paenibacillus faecalis TaxID=2079532 RepID=UPI000D10963C|nr:nucleotidyltransferase family protein [Paenibacillus faecalis]